MKNSLSAFGRKKILFISILLLAVGCQTDYTQPPPKNEPVACTMEAKLCPDGSYVSRTGPSCEFAACPSLATSTPAANDSGVVGNIVIGPTCPVERIPPDPACAPKGYQATVIVKTPDGKKEIKRFTSGSDGSFKVSLAPGTYLLSPINSGVYPRGADQTVVVEKNKYTQVTIEFDSGIR
ncbi:MAG TPA: hypothetical protein VE973_00725 [Candidatus Limnocylindria bacterium]|nr:hypothetical protein [Candidatus Limnocylindria bacterium]